MGQFRYLLNVWGSDMDERGIGVIKLDGADSVKKDVWHFTNLLE